MYGVSDASSKQLYRQPCGQMRRMRFNLLKQRLADMFEVK